MANIIDNSNNLELAVNVSHDKLHAYLCSLNFYIDFQQQNDQYMNIRQENDQNWEKNEKICLNLEDQNLVTIPNSFMESQDYIKIWKQLFFCEAKAQIVKENLTEDCQIDKYILLGVQKRDQFKIITMSQKNPSDIQLSSNDLILICYQNPNNAHDEHMLGVVEVKSDYLQVKIIFDIDNLNERTSKLTNIFNKDSVWNVKRLCNLVTLNREFQALMSIDYLHLKDHIFNFKNETKKSSQYFNIPKKLEEKLLKSYNSSQMIAINETLKKEGITLIQGPPGTGKTTTVLGTLSVLLNSKNEIVSEYSSEKTVLSQKFFEYSQQQIQQNIRNSQPWLQNDYEDWRDQYEIHFDINEKQHTYLDASKTDQFKQMFSDKTTIQDPPEKILICAPSNAAIDEIVRKILNNGLFDENGNRFDPYILRIGPNINPALQHVSFDYMLNQEIKLRNNKDNDILQIKKDILAKAKIVCGTLSSAGSYLLLQNLQQFDTVLIDEAAQAVEISTLIPLKYGCKRLILIGDQNQLPATIFSKKCEKYSYNLSLFERLQKVGYPLYVLDVQYRMHPQICQFVSESFYQKKLSSSNNIMDLIGKPDIYNSFCFKPFVFFNVFGQEIFEKNSYKNVTEIEFIIQLYLKLKLDYPNIDVNKNVGIISPYSQQVSDLREKIAEQDQTLKCNIEVNTVDGFQGREKDIIIFSTVRSQKEGKNKNDFKTIGFLKDIRRMNVSVSRARLCLIIVGDMSRLRIDKNWRHLISFAMSNQQGFNVPKNINSESLNNMSKNVERWLIKQKFDKKIKHKKELLEQTLNQEINIEINQIQHQVQNENQIIIE